MDINSGLVNSFRKFLNNNQTILLKIFGNVEGVKNHWRVIHSCLDWITVAINFIEKNWEIEGDHDEKSIHLYSLISAADLINESIVQLNRVFVKGGPEPFKGDNSIFDKGKLYSDLDDNHFFKEIRSIFGAHPVNLKRKEGFYYASWSFQSEYDKFSVFLYSLNPESKDVCVDLNVIELKTFIKSRYDRLNEFFSYINISIDKYKKTHTQSLIELKEGLEGLYLLKKEAIDRLDCNYINDLIDRLIKLYSSSTGLSSIDEEENEYKNELKKLIQEIRNNLQIMSLQELQYAHLLNFVSPAEISYSVEKLLTSLSDAQDQEMLNYHIKILNEYSKNKYQFASSDDINIIFLKLCLLLRSYCKND